MGQTRKREQLRNNAFRGELANRLLALNCSASFWLPLTYSAWYFATSARLCKTSARRQGRLLSLKEMGTFSFNLEVRAHHCKAYGRLFHHRKRTLSGHRKSDATLTAMWHPRCKFVTGEGRTRDSQTCFPSIVPSSL